uniref:Putative secreted protein n=1 Tax=Ixodes ricinus TaxID=34613 RepID=A0A6B0U493_IXORI
MAPGTRPRPVCLASCSACASKAFPKWQLMTPRETGSHWTPQTQRSSVEVPGRKRNASAVVLAKFQFLDATASVYRQAGESSADESADARSVVACI